MRDCWADWACRAREMQSQEGGEGAGHAWGSRACEGAKRTLYSGISRRAGRSRCGHQSAAGEASSSKEVLWSRRLVVTRSNWRGSYSPPSLGAALSIGERHSMRVRSPQRPSQNAEQTSGPACIKNACAPLKTGVAQCGLETALKPRFLTQNLLLYELQLYVRGDWDVWIPWSNARHAPLSCFSAARTWAPWHPGTFGFRGATPGTLP